MQNSWAQKVLEVHHKEMADDKTRRYIFLAVMLMWIVVGSLFFNVLMEFQENRHEKVIRPIFYISAIAAWIAYTLAVFYFSQDSSHIITFTAVILFLVILPATMFSMSTTSIISSN